MGEFRHEERDPREHEEKALFSSESNKIKPGASEAVRDRTRPVQRSTGNGFVGLATPGTTAERKLRAIL
jgi:hypothetical protein